MYGGFQGALNWAPLMSRDASLSDSYKSVGDGFPVWQSFYTEKTRFPFPFAVNEIWSWWQFGKTVIRKKKLPKNPTFFHLKIDFCDRKIFLKLKIGFNPIHLDQIFPMKPSRIWNFSFQSEVMLKKSAENNRNCFDAEKRIVSKLSNMYVPNFDGKNWRLESILCQHFMSLSSMLSQKKAVKERHGKVGPVHFFKLLI